MSINEIGRDIEFTDKAFLKTSLEFQSDPWHCSEERSEEKNIHRSNEKGVQSRNI